MGREWLEVGRAHAGALRARERQDAERKLTVVELELERATGSPARALDLAREHLDLCTELFPAGHPEHGRAQALLATALVESGRLEDARVHFEKALQILVSKLGSTHQQTIALRLQLGQTLLALDDEEGARREFNAGLLDNAARGEEADAVSRAQLRAALGRLQARAEHWSAAVDGFAQSLEILQGALGPSRREVLVVALDLSRAYRGLGRPSDAIALLEPLLADEAASATRVFAELQAELGIAYWTRARPGDRDRARALLKAAVEDWEGDGRRAPAPVAAWLEQHPSAAR